MVEISKVVDKITEARELAFGGQMEKSVVRLKQASISSGLGGGNGMLFGTSLNREGLVHRMITGHYPEARACFNYVLDPNFLVGGIEVPADQKGLALVNLGDLIRVDTSDNISAANSVLSALNGKDTNQLVVKGGLNEAFAWDQLGLINKAMGKPKAMENYDKAREIAEYNASRSLYDDPYEAIPEFGFDIIDAKHRLGEILHHIGVVFNEKGNPDESLRFQKRAAGIAEEIGHNHLTYNTTASVGAIHIARGEYEQAIEPLEKAREMVKKSGFDRGVAATDISIGCSYILSGNAEKGEQFFIEALDLFDKLSRNDLVCYESMFRRVEKEYHGPMDGMDNFKAFRKKAYDR